MRRTMILATVIATSSTVALAVTPPPMGLKVTGGKAMVWNKDAGGWKTVKDSTALAYGDSVFLDHYETATVRLGGEVTVLLKGLCRASVQGTDLDVSVMLVEGQLFFRRQKPYEYNSVGVVARTCRVTPIGTACAVRFTKLGEPSVALLAGKARMEAPGGLVALVGAGQTATFGNNNAFATGRLTARGVAALVEWSGVAYEGPTPPQGDGDVAQDAPAQQPAESPAAAAPGAPAVAPAPAPAAAAAPATAPAAAPKAQEQPPAGQTKQQTEPGAEPAAGEGGERPRRSRARERAARALAGKAKARQPGRGNQPGRSARAW